MHVPCRYFFPDMTILQVEYYFFRTSGYKQKAARWREFEKSIM